MKAFQLIDGDIALGPGNRATLVYGRDKLLQELKLWLQEPFGVGYTTPNFGSRLSSLIGEDSPDLLASEVEDEIRRVLSNFQAWQIERLHIAKLRGETMLFSKREILNSVEDVSVQVVRDKIVVSVRISTLSDYEEDITIPIVVDDFGVQIA